MTLAVVLTSANSQVEAQVQETRSVTGRIGPCDYGDPEAIDIAEATLDCQQSASVLASVQVCGGFMFDRIGRCVNADRQGYFELDLPNLRDLWPNGFPAGVTDDHPDAFWLIVADNDPATAHFGGVLQLPDNSDERLTLELQRSASIELRHSLTSEIRFVPDADEMHEEFAVSSNFPVYEKVSLAEIPFGFRVEDCRSRGVDFDLSRCRSLPAVSGEFYSFASQTPIQNYGMARLSPGGSNSLELRNGSVEPACLSADTNCDGKVRVAVMGDSYISGEGAYPTYFRPEFVASDGKADSRCHRSRSSWAYQVGEGLVGEITTGVDTGGSRVEMFACSGATYPTMVDGQHGENGQFERLDAMQARSPVDVVFLSIGGNDAGFSDVIIRCFLSADCNRDTQEIADLAADVVAKALKQARQNAPDAAIVVSGYPIGFSPNTPTCNEIQIPVPSLSGTDPRLKVPPFELSRGERRWIREDLGPDLNKAIKKSADAFGAFFFDATNAFDGAEMCSATAEPDHAARGLAEVGADGARAAYLVGLGVPYGQESFHPTPWGHELMRRYFGRGIRLAPEPTVDWARYATTLSPENIDPHFWAVEWLNGPPRTVNFRNPGRETITGVVPPGAKGLVFLESSPVLLGTLEPSSDGTASLDIKIPTGLYPGTHTLTVTTDNGTVLHTTAFLVEVDNECIANDGQPDRDGDQLLDMCDGDTNDGPLGDSDHDGALNNQDNCPYVYNPSQAVDADGLSLACKHDFSLQAVAAQSIGQPLGRTAASEPAPTCAGHTSTITGTPGNDILTGTDGVDVIAGLGGNDIIAGLGGNDIICGSQGDDTINAGDGFDKVFAGAGNDTINGGTGNDLLSGGGGDDTINGGTGNDRLQGGDGVDNLNGDGGSDRIAGNNGNDVLRGGTHNDQMFGNLGRDQLFGDGGNDVLRGGAWVDIMNGGHGANDGCTLTDPGGLTETRVNCEGGVFGR